jgi:hypothetical protein
MAEPLGDAPTVSWTTPAVPAEWATLDVPVVDSKNYQIVREVARGGVGRILEAVDTRLNRQVALKQLLEPGVEEARFIREAVLTARLQHPSIVPIHEVGVFSSGEPFIAMKLVRGESLRQAIAGRSTLAERLELVSAVLAVAEAIAYAHSQRVIHRDLKPSNVLLGSFGEVVVIDWGLAKHLDVPEAAPTATAAPASPSSTAVGAIVGTPAYMPPEQALGRPVDMRADVYSIGAMLYEVLTGEIPIAGDSAPEVLRNILQKRPIPVEQRAPGVPADLAAIVRKAMKANSEERYADGGELAADLRRYLLGQVVVAPRPDDAHDPALARAFHEELLDRSLRALRILCGTAMVLLPLFGIVARIDYGHFDRRDLVPRLIAITFFGLVLALSTTRFGRSFSQELASLLLLVAGGMVIVMNVTTHGALEAALMGSMILIQLGGAVLLPITPRRLFTVLFLLSIASIPAGMGYGLHLGSPRLITQVSLFLAAAAVGSVGSVINYRVRRAEFYNRHRLQAANERLARLERR